MKKFLCVFTILSVLLLFCACGKTAEIPVPTQSPHPAATSAPTPSPSPEPTPAPTERPLLEPVLTNDFIPADLFAPADEQGSIETIEYTTLNYCSADQEEVTKCMTVYLPYGYDSSRQYDLLIMMHISGCNENFWLKSSFDYRLPGEETAAVRITDLADNMIERGLCRPLIIAAPSGYINEAAIYEHDSERDFNQFALELRNDILPCLNARYSLYNNRDHTGFYGASFGAYMAYRSVLSRNFDNTAWFVLTGGGQLESDWLKEKWQSDGTDGLPLKCLLLTEGEYDDRGPVELGSYDMQANFDNVIYNMINGTGHDCNEWIAALYNALQLFFRE